MTYSIAVASGKGGTGKTTVAVSLYRILADYYNHRVQLVDCDVEEPNDILFFPEKHLHDKVSVYKKLPVIDREKCTYCRRCAEYCEFNAIVILPTAEFAEVNADLCHSCGACLAACNDNAIHEMGEKIGEISSYGTMNGTGILEGRLKIGSSMQTMLIRELKTSVSSDTVINILDAPPGTSCPVVETVSEADYVILVTEPTPFGLHDLQLTVSILQEMDKPFGVVINKAGLGNREIYQYLDAQQVSIIGELPFSRTFATEYAKGDIINSIPQEIEDQLQVIASHIIKIIAE
jgi:MinD superfamily P-loop ATPase